MTGQYSIKDIERLSGIKAHTLRIWEKRYNILEPNRTDTNIRFYSNDDLRKVLNIAILNNYGFKISKIVGLSADDLNQKVLEIGTEHMEESVQIESLIVSMIDIDESRFERIIANCTIRMGFEQTVLKVLYPFFKKVGILWQTGSVNPAQEHFISNLVRQKLIVAIDSQGLMERTERKRFLLFLPEGELHELGLLFYNYLIQKAGHKVIYLGQSVPLKDAIAVDKLLPADVILTCSLALSHIDDVNSLFQSLLDNFPDRYIYITNRIENTQGLISNPRLKINSSFESFKSVLS
jgi:DNA-binding transcriptional MerR regulator